MHSTSVISEFVLPGAKPHYNPDKKINLVHQILDLAISLNYKAIVGISTISGDVFENGLESIQVDAVNMEILEIVLNKKTLEFDYNGKIINIILPRKYKKSEKITVAIKYIVKEPVAGAFFVLPDNDYPDVVPELWTQGESETNRYWFPCLDYPQQIGTFRVNLRVPQSLQTLSNGLLVKQSKANPKDELINLLSSIDPTVSTKNYQVQEWLQSVPQPTYLTAIVVGDFDEVKDHYKDIAVNYYTTKGKGIYLKDTAGKTPKMMEFYAKKFGVEFVYPKYYQFFASDFNSGGMENASITINTDRVLADKKIHKDWLSPEILIAHELAHQWFGDLVVIDHWSHLWLKEGMATYSEALWIEKEYGYQEFQYYRYLDLETYLAENYTRPIVTNNYHNNRDVYDMHSYAKGGLVYHMIRALLGETDFELLIKTFLTENKHKTITSYDLLKAINQVSGKNLNWLFDKFLFSSGHPNLVVSFGYDTNTKLAKIEVEQKQIDTKNADKNQHPIKIPVAFNYLDTENKLESNIVEIEISQKQQSYYFALPKAPDFISFDYQNNLIKELELKFSQAELEKQLLHDSDPISRVYAIKGLVKNATLQTVKILEKAYHQEQFWGVRLEIAKALSGIKMVQSQDLLLKILEDKHSKVAKAAINSLIEFKTEKVYNTLLAKAKTEIDSIFVEASLLNTLGIFANYFGSQQQQELIEFYKPILETRPSWHEFIRSNVLYGLAHMNSNPQAIEIIIQYTKAGTDTYLRNSSFACLGKACINQEKPIINRVLDLIAGSHKIENPFLQNSLIAALSDIKLPRSVQILNQIKNAQVDTMIIREIDEIIETISKSFDDKNNLEELRKKIDQVTQDNNQLKGKLEELLAIYKNPIKPEEILDKKAPAKKSK